MQASAPAIPGVPISDEAGAAVPVTVNVRMSPLAEKGMRLPNPFPKFTSVQSAGTISLAVSEQVMPVGVNHAGTSCRKAPEWLASPPLAYVMVAVRINGVVVPPVIWGLSHWSTVPTSSTYVLKPKSERLAMPVQPAPVRLDHPAPPA